MTGSITQANKLNEIAFMGRKIQFN